MTAPITYADTETMLAARDRYFLANDFGADGGYSDKWVDLKVGPLHLPFPNTAARVKAVGVHDLHHLVTGYQTDLRGEAEISAWELGAGCKRLAVAWFLDLAAMPMGAVLAPKRLFKAYVRGRRSDTLYGRPYQPLLTQTVGQVRTLTGLAKADADPRPATVGERALFGVTLAAGAVAATAALGIIALLLPFGLLGLAAQKKARKHSAVA